MYLELEYYGQNDGTCVPNPFKVALTGDPGIDNAALETAGYKSGAIVSIAVGVTGVNATVVQPCDGATAVSLQGRPYGFLLLGGGQFSSSITPAGSGKTPVVRAFPKFKVPSAMCYGTAANFGVGLLVYAAGGADAGKYTYTPDGTATNAGYIPVGIVTHTPSTTEPWLGVAALI
jgi:hypothetical protein